MIVGEYPCCDGSLLIALPEKTPVWMKEECPHCGKTVWHHLSRVNPESYTEEAFNEKYELTDGIVKEKR